MAKGDTKTNQYLDIAANGTRADLPADTCCETRSQTLIREVAERIMDVEDEVEEIKNNPDVVDIVATYADLQAYDTQHLTDKDIIRVLQDETHDGESTYYRYNKQSDTWTYVGESKQYEDFVGTDGTAAGEAGLVPAPATTDAGKFLKADGTWDAAGSNYTAGDGIDITNAVISATNTGKAKTLTTDDYNYHSSGDTHDGVAIWLLSPGYYVWQSGLTIYPSSNAILKYSNKAGFAIVGEETSAGNIPAILEREDSDLVFVKWVKTTGVRTSDSFLMTSFVIDNLTSTMTNSPLSANQGKVLKDFIGDLANLTTTDKTNLVAAINEAAASGGGVTELTSADYNWNSISGESGTPDTIAVWKLDAGVYSWDELVHITDYSGTGYTTEAGICVVSTSSSSNAKIIIKWSRNGTTRFIVDNPTTGESIIWKFMLSSTSTKDNLTSTSTTEPLSANQGKVLKDLIDSIAIRGAGAPTTSTAGTVGQLYEDTTNGKLYICTAVSGSTYTWTEVGAGGEGSGVIELTSSDYNYHSSGSTDDGLAPWLLDPGMYYIKATPVSPIRLYNSSSSALSLSQNESLIINKTTVGGDPMTNVISYTNSGNIWSVDYNASGTRKKEGQIITSNSIVSSTGTSTTSVMSQNAVTSMVYADPSARYKVQIGSGASVAAGIKGDSSIAIGKNATVSYSAALALGAEATITSNATGGVAIGYNASADGQTSVALGSYSSATSKGQFDIGASTGGGTYGYNNSAYRLLTGLYDPQSDHDAATKGYVDGLISALEARIAALEGN